MKMKCLAISPVWSWAIAEGIKTIENRKTTTNHRGPLAIYSTFNDAVDHGMGSRRVLADLGYDVPEILPRGKVVCVVDVANSVAETQIDWMLDEYPDLAGNFATGPHCWVFRNAKRCEPFAARGMPGIFEVDFPQCTCSYFGGPCDGETERRDLPPNEGEKVYRLVENSYVTYEWRSRRFEAV